jgi:hypothetical protein
MRNPVAADGSKQNRAETGEKRRGKERSGFREKKRRGEESVATQDEMFTTSVLDLKKKKKGTAR